GAKSQSDGRHRTAVGCDSNAIDFASHPSCPSRLKSRARSANPRFHDLRHTCVTRMLEGGVPLSVVASILGWSPATTARMAKRYGHIGDVAQRLAVAILDAKQPRTNGGKETGDGPRVDPVQPKSKH